MGEFVMLSSPYYQIQFGRLLACCNTADGVQCAS